MLLAAVGYELLYRWASGEPFWSFYASRQIGVATAVPADGALLRKAANVAFYAGRILWFAFPWSLALVWEALAGRRVATEAVEPAAARRRAGVVFVAGTVLVYVLGFGLFDRRADRYVFPAYYAVGAAGVLAALARFPWLARLAERLDRPWLPAGVFALTLALHLVAGRVGVPRVDVPPR
jgi:hypothetical protein